MQPAIPAFLCPCLDLRHKLHRHVDRLGFACFLPGELPARLDAARALHAAQAPLHERPDPGEAAQRRLAVFGEPIPCDYCIIILVLGYPF